MGRPRRIPRTVHVTENSRYSLRYKACAEPTDSSDESDDDISTWDKEYSSRHKTSNYSKVDLIDDDGCITQETLKVPDIWTLPVGKKVIVTADDSGKPVDDAGCLLASFLGHLGCDYSKLPMSYVSWHKVPEKYKDKVYDDIIKKFHILDGRMPKFIMKCIGRKWRHTRLGLYMSFYDESLSMEENVRRCPGGIDAEQWKCYLLNLKNKNIQEMCKKNAENEKKQFYTYVGGSKGISRRKVEEERKGARTVGRREMGTVLRKRKSDGSVVNDAAKIVGEGKYNIEHPDGSSKPNSQDDSVARVLRKEHADRDGLGNGLSPAQIFGHRTCQCSGPSSTPVQDSKMDEIKLELEAEKLKSRELESAVDAEKSKRQELELVVDAEKSKVRKLEMLVIHIVKQGEDLASELAAVVSGMPGSQVEAMIGNMSNSACQMPAAKDTAAFASIDSRIEAVLAQLEALEADDAVVEKQPLNDDEDSLDDED